ncbi:MAG: hypothetical protein ACYC91_06220 [Solirubrobacteraceae bacterium]
MVKANRAYELLFSRGGRQPVFLADPERLDRVELVSIDDGEAVLFWELPAREAARLLRELRGDLARMDAVKFLEKWQGADA